MISCDRCPFGFSGDIVCMHCPTGYRINFDPGHHPAVGHTFPVTKMFHMSSETIDGKVRCSTFTEEQTTNLTVMAISNKHKTNGEVFETIRYQLNILTCVRCNRDELKFYLERPDTCPRCLKKGLRKHEYLGPILKLPQKQ